VVPASRCKRAAQKPCVLNVDQQYQIRTLLWKTHLLLLQAVLDVLEIIAAAARGRRRLVAGADPVRTWGVRCCRPL